MVARVPHLRSRAAESFRPPNAGLDDPPASSALEYEPVGSLAGTLRVKDRAVDFGASDMPLKSDELATLGLGQFPIVIGGVVVAVNIDGVRPGEIKLTGTGARRRLSRKDHALVGSRDQGAQSRR